MCMDVILSNSWTEVPHKLNELMCHNWYDCFRAGESNARLIYFAYLLKQATHDYHFPCIIFSLLFCLVTRVFISILHGPWEWLSLCIFAGISKLLLGETYLLNMQAALLLGRPFEKSRNFRCKCTHNTASLVHVLAKKYETLSEY